jgi:hypothetical protein
LSEGTITHRDSNPYYGGGRRGGGEKGRRRETERSDKIERGKYSQVARIRISRTLTGGRREVVGGRSAQESTTILSVVAA